MNPAMAGLGALTKQGTQPTGMPPESMSQTMALAKKMSDMQLADVLAGKSMDVPQYVAMTEAMGRKQLRTAMQGMTAMTSAKQPTEREKLLSEMRPQQPQQTMMSVPPQGAAPQGAGLDQLPADNMQGLGHADGGIIAFADRGQVHSPKKSFWDVVDPAKYQTEPGYKAFVDESDVTDKTYKNYLEMGNAPLPAKENGLSQQPSRKTDPYKYPLMNAAGIRANQKEIEGRERAQAQDIENGLSQQPRIPLSKENAGSLIPKVSTYSSEPTAASNAESNNIVYDVPAAMSKNLQAAKDRAAIDAMNRGQPLPDDHSFNESIDSTLGQRRAPPPIPAGAKGQRMAEYEPGLPAGTAPGVAPPNATGVAPPNSPAAGSKTGAGPGGAGGSGAGGGGSGPGGSLAGTDLSSFAEKQAELLRPRERSKDYYEALTKPTEDIAKQVASGKEQAQGEFLMNIGAALMSTPNIGVAVSKGIQAGLPGLAASRKEINALTKDQRDYQFNIAKAKEARDQGDEMLALNYLKLAEESKYHAGMVGAYMARAAGGAGSDKLEQQLNIAAARLTQADWEKHEKALGHSARKITPEQKQAFMQESYARNRAMMLGNGPPAAAGPKVYDNPGEDSLFRAP